MAAKSKPKALSATQREARNQMVLNLFLAGCPPRAIATRPQVKLHVRSVTRIIKAELDRATKDHILNNENAMIIHLARMESLVRAAFEHVNDGDLKAIEVTRRLLHDQSDIYELAGAARAARS